ncbi:integral membrane protein, YjbE family [Kluyvera cryocrescens]|uniref:Integral membrane protein, YjbE family n=1 Tax=Kluyvera cryocrescens TaxID=580 RepID=A0A485BIQ3_KLUCR|nr:integral membrane protein, YjbE family [Kluyvera cryocrescens]
MWCWKLFWVLITWWFIAILADKLPPKQRDKARLIGLSLAADHATGFALRDFVDGYAYRAAVHRVGGRRFSGRDMIMLVGGLFLLFKATTELHERLENRQHDSGHGKGYSSFWVVVAQIVVLDAVFSLDAVIYRCRHGGASVGNDGGGGYRHGRDAVGLLSR